jgi:hypothetical protein
MPPAIIETIKIFLGSTQVKGLPDNIRASITTIEMTTPMMTPRHVERLQSIMDITRTDKAIMPRISQTGNPNTAGKLSILN